MQNKSIEKISLITLAGIMFTIFSVFAGNMGRRILANEKKFIPVIDTFEDYKTHDDKISQIKISYELGLAMKDKDLIDEAIEENKKVILLDGKFIPAHLELGRLYWEKKDLLQAISEYRKVAELNPDYLDERSNVFLGEEIKNVIKKTIYELKIEEKKNPADFIQKGLNDAYYLRRKFGGGCE